MTRRHGSVLYPIKSRLVTAALFCGYCPGGMGVAACLEAGR
jgi:hypothetical protein